MSRISCPVPSTSTIARILLVDAYDSFTYNLVDQITRCTSAEVHIIHIDTPFIDISALLPHLSSFNAIVIGPGPGSPERAEDIGIIKDIWHLAQKYLLPIFGVCLGLQSLCLAFGGKVSRLNTVKHGLSSRILHGSNNLFEGVRETLAIRYHSLHAQLPPDGQRTDLEPLAWAIDKENGKVLMAVRHTIKPFWAVQYHPESICTEDGDMVILNFWRMANAWNKLQGRKTTQFSTSWDINLKKPTLLEKFKSKGYTSKDIALQIGVNVQTVSLSIKGLSTNRICETLGVEFQQQFILLDSAAVPGQWTIIGILSPFVTQLIQYYVGDAFLTVSQLGDQMNAIQINLEGPFTQSMWQFLASYMQQKQAIGGYDESPFWGGLMGYFSYEIGVNGLGIAHPKSGRRRTDVNLAFVMRSLVINTVTGQMFVQSLIPDDSEWLQSMTALLSQEHARCRTLPVCAPPLQSQLHSRSRCASDPIGIVTKPSKEAYTTLVRDAQAFLASGDSYELCLTARTQISLRSPPSPWTLYNRLRLRNAAPYAAYVRLQGITLLSSSPERFLSYSRTGHVQLRPIKGTVKKAPQTTFSSAATILNTPKERAENLMILDLIRHDLYRILGTGNVRVEKLMGVEEYASVYQLVSVISGDLSVSGATGLDVLSSSLPPGSMTGAPKKRSVQILQGLESADEERGIYSGVVGYMSVCGAGDWSVVIRSAFRYDDEDPNKWWVGAGGAVTALSRPEAEYEEMLIKLESTLGAFDI